MRPSPPVSDILLGHIKGHSNQIIVSHLAWNSFEREAPGYFPSRGRSHEWLRKTKDHYCPSIHIFQNLECSILETYNGHRKTQQTVYSAKYYFYKLVPCQSNKGILVNEPELILNSRGFLLAGCYTEVISTR